jgi:hypothetical protein
MADGGHPIKIVVTEGPPALVVGIGLALVSLSAVDIIFASGADTDAVQRADEPAEAIKVVTRPAPLSVVEPPLLDQRAPVLS